MKCKHKNIEIVLTGSFRRIYKYNNGKLTIRKTIETYPNGLYLTCKNKDCNFKNKWFGKTIKVNWLMDVLKKLKINLMYNKWIIK